MKRKEEKTEVISVRVPGSAKVELDELRQRAEAGGFDLAGSMSEAVVRIIKQIGAELREPAGTATDHHARCDRSGGPMYPGRSMVRRRSHSCGVERAAADAAWSPVALRGGPTHGIAPGSISAVHTECSKPTAVGMQRWVDVLRTFFRRTRHSSWDDCVTCKHLKSQR